MLQSSHSPYQPATTTAPTPGCRSDLELATPEERAEPLPRQSGVDDAVVPRGARPRIAYVGPDVRLNAPLLKSDTAQLAANGQFTGNLQPALRKHEGPARGHREIDRVGCPARADAKGVHRHGTVNAYKHFFCRCPDAR